MWAAQQYAYLNADKYEDNNGKSSRCSVSFLEKQKDGSVKYSRYFCAFVGSAYEKVSPNHDIKSFKLMSAKMTNAPYENADGEKKYPKYPTLVIYDVDDIKYNNEADSNPF